MAHPRLRVMMILPILLTLATILPPGDLLPDYLLTEDRGELRNDDVPWAPTQPSQEDDLDRQEIELPQPDLEDPLLSSDLQVEEGLPLVKQLEGDELEGDEQPRLGQVDIGDEDNESDRWAHMPVGRILNSFGPSSAADDEGIWHARRYPISKIRQEISLIEDELKSRGLSDKKRKALRNKRRTTRRPRLPSVDQDGDDDDDDYLRSLVQFFKMLTNGDTENLKRLLSEEKIRRQKDIRRTFRHRQSNYIDRDIDMKTNPLDDIQPEDWVMIDDNNWERENDDPVVRSDDDVIGEMKGDVNGVGSALPPSDVINPFERRTDDIQDEDEDAQQPSEAIMSSFSRKPGITINPKAKEPFLLETLYESLKYEPPLLAGYLNPKNDQPSSHEQIVLPNEEEIQIDNQLSNNDLSDLEVPQGPAPVHRRPILSWQREASRWINSDDDRWSQVQDMAKKNDIFNLDDGFGDLSPNQLAVGESPIFIEQQSQDDFANNKRIDVKKPGPKFLPPTQEDGDTDSDSVNVQQEDDLKNLIRMTEDADQQAPPSDLRSSVLVSPIKRSPISDWDRRQTVIMTMMISAFVATITLLVGTIVVVVRRHENLRRKLSNLMGHFDITDTMSAYQDLCRQRMQSKKTNDGEDGGETSLNPESIVTSGQSASSTTSPTIKKGSTSKDEASPSSTTKVQSSSLSSESSTGSSTMTGPSGSRSSSSSWSESQDPSTPLDISTGHMILNYMEDHLKNRHRLDQEWEGLAASSATIQSGLMSVSSLPTNRKKNRYPDILPFDSSRVILSNSEYINASKIMDHDPRTPSYIATQGPLPATIPDFWQMVYESKASTIVMLTKLIESGQIMCHRYWPGENATLKYGQIEVTLLSEQEWCEDFLSRSLLVKNVKSGESRTVTQFHLMSWPEKGVPPLPKVILDFRRKVNKCLKGSNPRPGPVVVHCSDGCGRTGTYCLIDMVLNRLSKGAKEIDIAATLEHLRDQRMMMVRTKSQFEYVLRAVAEEFQSILQTLKSSSLNSSSNSVIGSNVTF